HLIRTLEEPDPAGPRTLRTKYTVLEEVVRINHLNNCLLCHPPAVAGGEPVPGVDPVVNMTVPATAQAANLIARLQGIAAGGGGHDYANRATSTTGLTGGRGRRPRLVPLQVPVVVRADITFVRQDFSVQLPPTVPGVALPVIRPIPGRTPLPPTGVR